MSKYEKDKIHLQKVENQLQQLVSQAEVIYKSFHRMTQECCNRIQKCYSLSQQSQSKSKPSWQIFQFGLKHYLKQWFRSFLGIKDECMILITGELVRSYHVAIHESYTHERSKESYYYNRNCTLSACSIDGVDYEYRMLVEKYGNKAVSHFDLICYWQF